MPPRQRTPRTASCTAVQKLRSKYARRGRLRFSSTPATSAVRWSGRCVGRGADSLLGGLPPRRSPTPTGRRQAPPVGQVLRISVTGRSMPMPCAPRSLPLAPRRARVVEGRSRRAGRPAGASSWSWSSDRPRSPISGGGRRLSRRRRGAGEPDVQDRHEDLRHALGRRDDVRCRRSGSLVRYFGWSCGTTPSVRPTTS